MIAYRRLRGRNYDRVITEFGERIWYMKTTAERADKIEPRWEVGVYLGSREESNEILVGTANGVIKSRTFRCKGSEEERWDEETILGVKGTPWEPNPGVQSYEIRSRVHRAYMRLYAYAYNARTCTLCYDRGGWYGHDRAVTAK